MSRQDRRQFLKSGVCAGATLGAATAVGARKSARAADANSEIGLGFISCGGRAGELMGAFGKLEGVRTVALCDPDQQRLANAKKRFPEAEAVSDVRILLEMNNVDAVVVATCNHWHCLAAIWAMQAGKDVYVEKPLSHSQWEGRQAVAAARKYDKICQLGTQQRSDPMQAEIKKFLHEDKALGEIVSARVNRYGIREEIGKRTTPLLIDPKEVDMNLWLGPAQEKPIFRSKLQYDWHWDWNTGSGEMGNWGVHVLDDLRNNVLLDKVALPKRILGGGGRVVWDDAGESPNIHFVYFDTGIIPVVIGLSNLPAEPGSRKSPPHPAPGSGYIAYCEGGRLEGQRGSAVAYDRNGTVIKKFRGSGGMGYHQQNFIDAVRSRDRSILNAEVQIGNDTTGWCNLANIAFRAGQPYDGQQNIDLGAGQELWDNLLSETKHGLAPYGLALNSDGIQMSSILEMDAATERFVGQHADEANGYLKRQYRAPFVVPEIA